MPEALGVSGQNFERPEPVIGASPLAESGPTTPEQVVERPAANFASAERPTMAAALPTSTSKTVAASTKSKPAKDELTNRIEKIMEDGIGDVYATLTPAQKEDFRQAGEETLIKLRRLMDKAKFALAEAWQLIRKWLSLLPQPSAGTPFIEQAAFIKAQQIAKIAVEFHHAIIR